MTMDDTYLRFDLNRMPNGEVHGMYTGCVWRNGQPALWLTSPFGRLAIDAFPEALALAREHGIEQIAINDPTLFAKLGLGTIRSAAGAAQND